MSDHFVDDPDEDYTERALAPAAALDVGHARGVPVGDADAFMAVPEMEIEGGGKKCSCCKKSPCMCGNSCRKCRGKMGGDCACGAGTKMGGGNKRSKSRGKTRGKARSKSRSKARSKSRSRK